ncbi:hypothetical protein TNCV_5039271 [Trichonephila clavipes]|nr:hypothetical protein TNCV_5039271 [Trichonephila clavipes]
MATVFFTSAVFCWRTSCQKKQQSTQEPTAHLYGTSVGQCKTIMLLSKGVLLLHDNARPHTSRMTQQLIEFFGWEVSDHAPYSSELDPSDFHLFRYLKQSWL